MIGEILAKAAEVTAETVKEVGTKVKEGFEKIKPEKETPAKELSHGVKEEFENAKDYIKDGKDVLLKEDGQFKKEPEAKETDNKDPVEKVKCMNEDLAGKEHPDTGVPYERKIVEVNGVKKEVVVPKFDSKFDAKLSEDKFLDSDWKQFKECNKQLSEAVEKDPELKAKFDKDQLEQIKNRDTPDGYVWHHDAEPGKMQLVDSETHQKTPHTGGRSIWGGGGSYR